MKREIGRRGREVDVATRLVRFGLEREAEVVALVAGVLAEKVDGVAKPLDRVDRVLRRIHLGALAPAPEHVRARAKLHAEVHRSHRLLHGVRRGRAASLDVKAPSLKTGSVKRFVVAIGTVMPVSSSAVRNSLTMRSRSCGVASIGTRSLSWKLTPHAPSFASLCTARHRIERRPDEVPERVAAAIADRPEAEGEFVGRAVGCQVLMASAVEIDIRRRDQRQHDRRVDHIPLIPAARATPAAGRR